MKEGGWVEVGVCTGRACDILLMEMDDMKLLINGRSNWAVYSFSKDCEGRPAGSDNLSPKTFYLRTSRLSGALWYFQ